MDCEELILLIEQCYERSCRKRRMLCWNFSGLLCTNSAEVIDLIRSSLLSMELPMARGMRVASFSLLVSGTIKGFSVGDPLGILGSLLACRVFSTLRNFLKDEQHSFFLQRNILQAVAEIKQWIMCVTNCGSFYQFKSPLEKRSTVQLVESVLRTTQALDERCCFEILAQLFVVMALQQKKLFFVPSIGHSDLIYDVSAYSGEFSDVRLVFDHAILLPVSLSLEAQLLLLDSDDRRGSIILFSCSLLIDDSELELFVDLIRSLHISFLASQRILCPALKETLFEMNIVPLERLSLTHSSVVQAVTGATPFHSLSEFVMWMKSIETGNVCVHVGEVEKVVTLNDGRIWIYGNGNIATVVVPIRNPFALNAIIRDCEHASHVACAILRGFAGHDLDSTGVYGAFFAEYLHHCYLLHCDKNKYHRKIVDVLRFTLLSHASNTGGSTGLFFLTPSTSI
ncbi:hypothetical protein TRSC58_06932 [Trypanosoma rangeli SC58]|uniref:Uncharacterized protein n=1 Tax=Trypanosoma rangeli SC58 TaxID=429131 RepID=A0A061IU67_TRYRA|nr:hypothetical protein TRSC58_06932 [Trypanosoma rangeli SC58]